MKTGHTPGPWHMGIGNGVGSIFGPEGHRMAMTDAGTALSPICIMVEGFGGVSHRHEYGLAEDLANARLIAAAPELLEALIGVVDCAGLGRLPGYEAEIDSAVKIARAAIAKATA